MMQGKRNVGGGYAHGRGRQGDALMITGGGCLVISTCGLCTLVEWKRFRHFMDSDLAHLMTKLTACHQPFIFTIPSS